MKTIRETLTQLESKILPINNVDHRFRLEQLNFGFDGLTLQAVLLTSNEANYSIRCTYSFTVKSFSEWTMTDATGSEFQVVGLVSKTLYYFVRKATSTIVEALGYEIVKE